MHAGQRYLPRGDRSPAAAAVVVALVEEDEVEVGGGAKGKKQEKQVGGSVRGWELRGREEGAGVSGGEGEDGRDGSKAHWRTRS